MACLAFRKFKHAPSSVHVLYSIAEILRNAFEISRDYLRIRTQAHSSQIFFYGLKDNLFKWFQFYNLDHQIGIKEK